VDKFAEVEKLLMTNIQPIINKGSQNISRRRHFQLSLTEGFIRHGIYDDVEGYLLKLKFWYESIDKRENLAIRACSMSEFIWQECAI